MRLFLGIAVVIVLVYIYIYTDVFKVEPLEEKKLDGTPNETVESLTSEKMLYDATHQSAADVLRKQKNNIENTMIEENYEHYDNRPLCTYEKGRGAPSEYLVQNYLDGELTYNDFMTSQGVTADVFDNHSKFVEGRGDIKGRTISYDMHASQDYIPWVGLNRPQNVPIGDPDQTPEVDRNWYAEAPSVSINLSRDWL